jgi:hypothetical protein
MTDAIVETMLADLRAAYDADHAEMQRAAMLPAEAARLGVCRYCSMAPWRPLPSSKLDGHTQCQVSDGFKARLAEVLASRYVTALAVAVALGVNKTHVNAWFALTRIRRTG